MLSNTSVASSTNSSHGERPNKRDGKGATLWTLRIDDVITTADADAISVGGDTEAHFVTADIINYPT